MAEGMQRTEKVPSFCALCISRCGATATLEDGRFTGLEADPAHPTGQALCIKGKVAPELVYHPDRLVHPMKRTNPKGDADPGWQQIGFEQIAAWNPDVILLVSYHTPVDEVKASLLSDPKWRELEAVKQVVEQGRSVSEVANGLGINRNMLTRWKRQFETEGEVAFPGHGRQTDAEAEIKRLKRELAIARQERDILRKAAAYFANAKN